MKNPEQKTERILDELIPGHPALRNSEKELGLQFLNWFRQCAEVSALQKLSECAADVRGDRVKCLKALRELAIQVDGGKGTLKMLTRLTKLEPNAFLIITAKLKEIAEKYAHAKEEDSKETKKIRFEVSEEVKRLQ